MEKSILPIRTLLGGAAIVAVAGLIGCLGRSPPAEFFLLEPAHRAGSGERPAGPVIALGPVRIPEYLDRPEIVTAKGRNAYRIDDRHLWAERLDDNIARVLARDIEALTPARQVLTGLSERGPAVDFRVAVTLLEFHVEPEGKALLTAQWAIRRGNDTVLSRVTSLRAEASTQDYGRMVAALNDCVNGLGRAIAEALRGLTG